MRALVYSLSQKAYHSLSDDHLWFSIFSRPPATSFTRVQRCMCCFVLLFTVMLLDILYYGQAAEEKGKAAASVLSMGPFHITQQQVGEFPIARLSSHAPDALDHHRHHH